MKSFARISLLILVPLAAIATAATQENYTSLEASAKRVEPATTRISISPGATLYRRTDGFQTTFSIMERIFSPLYVGIESGYMKWKPSNRSDYKGMPVGQSSVPLLLTALFRFENDSGVHPYLGGSAGIVLTRQDNSSENHFQLAAFARPGVEFEISRSFSLMLEPKVGVLDDSFLFAPQVGLTLSL